MKLELLPTTAPLGTADALIVRGESPDQWLGVLQSAGIPLEGTTAYALPGTKAGSVWGCLFMGAKTKEVLPPAIERLQLIGKKLFVPEWTTLFPTVQEAELGKLLSKNLFLLHPQIGLVDLEEALDWSAIIALPMLEDADAALPAAPIFIPAHIRSVEVRALDTQTELERLEAQISPDGDPISKEDPLSLGEKAKLAFYKLLLERGNAEEGTEDKSSRFKRWLQKLKGSSNPLIPDVEKMEADLEELERRSQSALDRLLQMLKENPSEALKYSIPLGDGTERGDTTPGGFGWAQRWASLALWGNSTTATGKGSAHLGNDQQFQLLLQYKRTAKELIAAGKHHQAAFVFLKLLKDGYEAANALELGGDYAGAAALFLKHTSRKDRAAGCYEKGHMITEAIALYKELGDYETAGDLYLQLSRRQEAMDAYKRVSEACVAKDQFIKAATLHREKMDDPAGAQELLLRGWRRGKDAYNCLHSYCRNLPQKALLPGVLTQLYQTEVNAANTGDFLKVLRGEMAHDAGLGGFVRDMAYGIIAERAVTDSSIVNQLPLFNKGDALVDRDVLRYRSSKRKG